MPAIMPPSLSASVEEVNNISHKHLLDIMYMNKLVLVSVKSRYHLPNVTNVILVAGSETCMLKFSTSLCHWICTIVSAL